MFYITKTTLVCSAQPYRLLIEDDARPVIFFPRGAVCRSPSVKGLTLMVNSIYNGSRFEDLWLDD